MSVRLRHRQIGERGAALVEFTLAAPILISLLCGLTEFGLAFRQYHVMEKGVRDAGRFLARVYADPPCTGATDGAWANAVADAKHLAIYGSVGGTTPLLASWTDPASVSVPDPVCIANPSTGGTALPKITITAAATFSGLGLFGALGLSPPMLSVSHQELKVD